jgi:hypothetical protein
MSTSRREFLHTTGIAAAGLTLYPGLAAAVTTAPEPGKTGRPGLLFDQSDLPRIRAALKHPHIAPWWESVVKADLNADRTFLGGDIRFNNHVRDMMQVRLILERTSFAFAVGGDRAQGEVALLAAKKILEYPKWDYFLEAGEHVFGLQRAPEATIAMACAREWLAPILSKETAAEIERQIAEKGAPACYLSLYGMKYPDRVRGWGFDPEEDYPYKIVDLSRWPLILNATNLKAIPIAGLGLAGCLLRGKHPQAERWIDMAVQSARAFSAMFGPDGCYDEGVGYWGYTALHMTLLAEVVQRTVGTDLRSLINFPGTVRYGLQMAMPLPDRKEDCVNFGDAWTMGDVSVAAWTARRLKDPLAQHVATSVGQMRNHYAAIWLDPGLPAKKPGNDLLDVRFSNDIVVSRSGWGADDGLVALRSGGPANHEHADRNSVIFKAYGERLFHDPYKAAYPYTEPHWVLRLTQSHTALLIDGKGHQYHDGHEGTNASWAEAKIIEYKSARTAMVVTSDATAAYKLVNEDVVQVHRTLVFLKPDILLIHDRVRLGTTELPVQIRFQVDNSDEKGSVAAEGNTFDITRPRATLHGTLHAGGTITAVTGKIDVPAEKGIHPYAEAESAAALDHALLTICTAQAKGKEHGSLAAAWGEGAWTITGTHNGRRVNVKVRPDIVAPGITLG